MESVTGDTMVSVGRAVSDLRRGDFVVIEAEHETALAQAAEKVTADSLAMLGRLAPDLPSLALTAERARVLSVEAARSPVVTLPLAKTIDVRTVRSLADPTYPEADLPTDPAAWQAADHGSCASAAVRLSKLAQLLPAALTARLPRSSFDQIKALADERSFLRVEANAIVDYPALAAETLQPVSEARVPLAGAENARLVGFRPADGGMEQFAIVIGEPAAHQPALCRLHGACFTGDLLGSLRCDCGPQLQRALQLMGKVGHGVLLYLAHEGRGIGLINKLRAYRLQDAGLDTVDANLHLGFEPDERSFRAAAIMLRHLGIGKVRLLTNNPSKVDALVMDGIEVSERIPHAMPTTAHNRSYLATKARRSGHLLDS